MNYPKEFKYLSHLKTYLANCSDVEKLKLVADVLNAADVLKIADVDMSASDDEWRPINTAPKDGMVIQLMHHDKLMPKFYSAWWMPYEQYETQDGLEYDGHYWVLNDDDSQLNEEDTDLSKWYWKPLPKGPK